MKVDHSVLFPGHGAFKGCLRTFTTNVAAIGVREGILLGGRKKFALKITICLETNFFSLIRMEPETSSKSVLYS